LLANGDNELIESWVKNGQRPPLDAVTGPADLMSFAKKWIAKCWHKSTDKRPSFASKQLSCVVVEVNKAVLAVLCIL